MITNAYIDAANLFYGGKKFLGWSIDYKKLREYLYFKYNVSEIYLFGGIEIHNFPFDYQKMDTVPLIELEQFFIKYLKTKRNYIAENEIKLISKYLKTSTQFEVFCFIQDQTIMPHLTSTLK